MTITFFLEIALPWNTNGTLTFLAPGPPFCKAITDGTTTVIVATVDIKD